MPTLISAACKDLSALREGVDLALGKLTAADQAVEQSLAPMGRAGFAAAFTQLRQAQQQVRQLRTRLMTARTGVQELAAFLSTLPEEVSAQDLVAVLAPAGAQLDTVRTQVEQVWRQIRPAVSAVAAAANRNPAVAILADLERTRMSSIWRVLIIVREHLQALLVEAQEARSGGAGATVEQPAFLAARVEPGREFDPLSFIEDMPVFVRSESKTFGRRIDARGNVRSIVSGRHGGTYRRVSQHAISRGVIPRGTMQVDTHVETKVAWLMWQDWRQTGVVPRETLVINNLDGPCGNVIGCDVVLPRLLPPGGELTVHWPGGHSKTYQGDAP